MPCSTTIEVPASPGAADQACAAIREFGAEAGLSSAQLAELLVIVDELVSNTIRHGLSGDQGQHRVRLRAEAREGELRLTFTDDAGPYDPLEHRPPSLDGPLHERELGGLGLHLVRAMSTSQSYERRGGHNVLTLSIPLKAHRSGGTTMPLAIHFDDSKPAALRIALGGSLDSETAPQLEAALQGRAELPALVVFDMAELEFISSAGLRVVFATLKRQKARGGRVALSHLRPGVRKVFEIVKALPDLTVFASSEEMDAYLARFQRGDARD